MAGTLSGITFIVQIHGQGATATDNLIQAVNNASNFTIGNSIVQVAASLVPGPAGTVANAIALSLTGVAVTENKVTTAGDLMGMAGSLAGMLGPLAAAAGFPFAAGALTVVAASLAIGGLIYTLSNFKYSEPNAVSPLLGTLPDPLVRTTVRMVDPLILDLDGDGLEIAPLAAGVLFDANGDTVKTGTAWFDRQWR
jgi:hypothetical protein